MLSTRTSSRGAGISKRERPVRVDRDGDLDMDRPSGRGRNGRQLNRGRGRRHLNLNEPSRGSTADHSGRNASGNGAGKSRGGGRGHNANRSHGGSNRKPTGPLGEVKVEGWAVGKGSFEDCIDFLEKKAKMRFSKVRTNNPVFSFAVSVDATPYSCEVGSRTVFPVCVGSKWQEMDRQRD